MEKHVNNYIESVRGLGKYGVPEYKINHLIRLYLMEADFNLFNILMDNGSI